MDPGPKNSQPHPELRNAAFRLDPTSRHPPRSPSRLPSPACGRGAGDEGLSRCFPHHLPSPLTPLPKAEGTASSTRPGLRRCALNPAVCLAAGCHREQAEANRSVSQYPAVRIVKPALRTIDYAIDQPGVVDAYRADLDFFEGFRLHPALLRGHRPSGQEGRAAGGHFRSRAGRRAPAEDGPSRVGQEIGRAGPAVGRRGREQRSDGHRPVGRSQGECWKIPGRGGSLGVGVETAHANGGGKGRRPADSHGNAAAIRFPPKRRATPRRPRWPRGKPTG